MTSDGLLPARRPNDGRPGAVTRRASAATVARRREVADYVMRQGSAAVTELAEAFGVSAMTIHRDLDDLEEQGLVRKYRGGATAQPSSVFESSIGYRRTAHQAEKEAIAAEVLKEIEPGMSLMLDDSTTALAIARRLGEIAPLTVATNHLETMQLLAGAAGLRLLALGGEYHTTHESFLGVGCVDAIEATRTDLVIVSTSAISDADAFHQEQEIVTVKRAMVRAGERRILAVDHSKLDRRALHRVGPLSDYDLLVVDAGAPEDFVRRLRDRGVEVRVAAPAPA
jgi:DeoR/GlpR family transcriptional regulator of sugar metabolism